MDVVVYGYEQHTWDAAAATPAPPANEPPAAEAA